MLVLLLLSILVPLSLIAQTEVEMGIESTFAERIPLWMPGIEVRSGGLEKEARKLDEVIRADLEFSGLFQVKRGRPRLRQGENDRMEIVLQGFVVRNGNDNIFEGRVFDTGSSSLIGGRRYRLKPGLLRKVAHHFSDEVVRMLTGEKGVAQTKILYVRKSDQWWELVMCDYDGYSPVVILRQSQPILNPRWLGGREALVYTGYSRGKPDLYIRRLAEPVSKALASFPGMNYSVDWSQRRKQLLVTLSKDGNPEIYLLGLEDKVLKRLTYHRAIDCSPSWSPSGRELVFTSDRSGSPQLYLMEADGSNLRRLTFFGNYNASPAWSPRGDLIAFVSRMDGYFQLCTMRPDGTGFTVLTSGRSNHDGPRWAADGFHIVYGEQGRSGSYISIIDITTGGRRILSQGESPDWSPP